MKITKSFNLSLIAYKILLYGLYSVVCHGVLIMLCVVTSNVSNGRALAILFAPMLEYTVMSLTIILSGALLADTVYKDLYKN